ncbi:MAG: biopolymer transporter ExbD [Spirochaetes bacterium]|nr:MAG: biopolymer transporter ExbD [Spirochaetota bacterium]
MRFRRRLSIRTTVDLIPLIDVVFQLVIFFMVSTTFILTPGISIELPGSTTAEPVVMSKMIVTIVSRDEIYLNKDRYNIQELDGVLSALSQEEKAKIKTVVIEGDESVSYSLMIEVLDVLRKNGFRGVNLRTREVKGRL